MFLFVVHAVHVDLFEDTKLVVAFIVDEVAFSKCAFTEDFDLLKEADVHYFKFLTEYEITILKKFWNLNDLKINFEIKLAFIYFKLILNLQCDFAFSEFRFVFLK